MSAEDLRSTSEKIGQLYPILLDYHGKVIDGKHRLGANNNWRRLRLKHIKTEKDRIIARIISNNVRRDVSSKEKRCLLEKLGRICLSDSVSPGKIASKIAEETGMSYRWVTKYLPSQFKDKLQADRARLAARHATETSNQFRASIGKQSTVVIRNYVNTDFVSLLLDKNFYSKFERHSLEVGEVVEYSVLKALKEYQAKMKMTIQQRNEEGKANCRILPKMLLHKASE